MNNWGVSGQGVVTLCVCVMTLLCGCETTRPGVTRTFSGKYTRYFNASPEVTHDATVRALGRADLMSISDDAGNGTFTVVSRDAQDTQVTVYIEPSGASTFVSLVIKPGTAEEYSLRLLKMINEEIKSPSNK